MKRFFPVGNLSASQKFDISSDVMSKIDLAQRDHVSVNFQEGIIRVILADITNQVVLDDVADGSFAQYVATEIAEERNLQSHIMRVDGVDSLVVISQLDGPKDNIQRLEERFANFCIN